MPLRLTPGPFEVSPTVSAAGAGAYCGHRTPYFRKIIAEVRDMLLGAYAIRESNAYAALLLTGTGSAAMEMMTCSTVRVRRPLAVVNGRFGKRLADMALLHNPETHVLEFEAGEPIDLGRVERAMDRARSNQLLFCVQDTRDAILNPFRELCAMAKRREHLLTVDAISAAVFEDIDFENCGIDMFVDSSGKGARSLPGVGILVARRDSIEMSRRTPAGSYYLDLAAEFDIQDKRNEPRFAPAVSLYVALHQALKELLEQGLSQRRASVEHRTEIVRETLEQSDLFKPLRPWAEMPVSVSSAILPRGVKFKDVEAQLLEEGISVYSGSSVRDDVLQIGAGGFMTDDILREGLDRIVTIVGRLTGKARRSHVHAT